MNQTGLPVTRKLTMSLALSISIMVLILAGSVAGVIFPDTVYPTPELNESFLSNDFINLAIGLPVIILSIWLAYRSNLAGLLLWPGALMYVFYNYMAYLFGMPPGLLTILYALLVLLSGIGFVDLIKSIDTTLVKEKLEGKVPILLSAILLILFGLFFIFRAVDILNQGSMGGETLSAADIGLLISDIVLSIIWIACAVLLLRRSPLGFTTALGLLYGGIMLFVGLIILLIIQPYISGTAFIAEDVIVVGVMGVICAIPFVLYLRGVLR